MFYVGTILIVDSSIGKHMIINLNCTVEYAILDDYLTVGPI